VVGEELRAGCGEDRATSTGQRAGAIGTVKLVVVKAQTHPVLPSHREFLALALLFCFAVLAAYGQDSPIQVEIRVERTAVQNNVHFSVPAVLRNTSKDEQTVGVLPCCFSMEWVTDNPSVHLECAESCMHNFPHPTSFKPGDAFESKLLVRVALAADKSQNESVTFRLGFRGSSYDATAARGGLVGYLDPPRWSNAVTVSVTR